jgi:hypothetical protein
VWSALGAIAVPLLGVLGAVLKSLGSRHTKRIGHHADLLAKLTDAPAAHERMQALLSKEVAWLDERVTGRLSRKLNGGNVFLAIVLSVLSAALFYFLAAWVVATAGTPWAWASGIASGVLGVCLVVLVAAGFSTIYDPPKTAEERRAAKEAKRLEREEARSSD